MKHFDTIKRNFSTSLFWSSSIKKISWNSPSKSFSENSLPRLIGGKEISALSRLQLRAMQRLPAWQVAMGRHSSPNAIPTTFSDVEPRACTQRHDRVLVLKPHTCLYANEAESAVRHPPRRLCCPQPGSSPWPSALGTQGSVARARENILQLQENPKLCCAFAH